MDLVKGTLCFCGSGKKIEECCVDFDSPASPEAQMKMRYEYRYLEENDDIILLARQKKDNIELEKYLITDDDREKMERCSTIISEKKNMNLFYDLFSSEYAIIAKYEDDIKKGKESSKVNDINRIAINFVSNAKLFIDFLENFVEEKYPEGFPAWKRLQSKFFDENYEYPIMYHLRNHVQHVGFPIRTINSKLVEADGKEFISVEFCLSRQELLKDKKLNKHARECICKIEVMEDNISFMPLVQEYAGMIQALYLLALKIFIKHNIEELKYLEDYFAKRGLLERIYIARVKKKNLINGTFNGMTLELLHGRAEIYNLYIELEQVGVVKVRMN